MRKWMQERLKRRKKTAETPAAEPAPAPLRPAFYDAEPAVETAPVPEREAPAEAPKPTPVREISDTESQPVRRLHADDAQKRRRRRSRGRGRRGSTAQPVPAGVSSPSVPTAATQAVVVPESLLPTAAAPITQPAASRSPKGTVVLAIGLPGSGKSSWFKRHNITPLSSDLLRALLFDDPTEQRFQDLVFSNLRSMLKARLIARRPLNYVDATNLTSHDRHGWIKLAKDYGYEVQAVFFDVPLEVCLERNQRRERVVADDVMRRMAGKMKPPTFEEGFSKITVVRVKQKEQ